MEKEIQLAFGHRQLPQTLTEIAVSSSLRDEALWFAAKEWSSITLENWVKNSDAYYGFSPDAFIYYLPSILTLSLKHPNATLIVADNLVSDLDTSADPDIWPKWFSDRFCLLQPSELGALKAWVEFYLSGSDDGEGSELSRVRDTLTMLELTIRN